MKYRMSYVPSVRQFAMSILVLAVASTVDAAVLSTEEFVALYPKWQQFAKTKTRLVIEGRISSRVGQKIQLQKCEHVIFRTANNTRLPTTIDKKMNLELSGYLKRTNGNYNFVVERHSIPKSDMQRLLAKKRELIAAKPDRWYSLGKKGLHTAEFFEDEELKREAEAILVEGIRREERSLPENDTKALRALADRINSFKLDESHRLELIHDALWIEWQSDRKNNQPLEELIKQVVKDLPGADKPIAVYDEKARIAYLSSPSLTYRKTKSEDRPLLHRFLLITIQLTQIERRANPDGRNGYEIAALIESSLPEFRNRPTEYRRSELKHESSRIDRLSQAEMRQLAKRYLDIGDDDEAKVTVLKWVQSLESRFRTQGPSGIIKSADLYRDELRDRKKEAELLQEAWIKLSGPKLERERNELEKRLQMLDWSRRGQQWVKGMAPDKQHSTQPTGVQIGMTPEQVRKALNGSPTSKTRVASKDKTTELWVYRDAGLVVQLEHPTGGSSTVVKIKGLR